MEFLRWQWIIFFAPLCLAVLLALSSVIGLGGHGDADAEADHDLGGDTDTDHDAGHEPVLSLIGVGKAPLSVVLLCLLFLWGTLGVAGNLLWSTQRVLLSLSLAGVGALLGTRALTRLFARLLPSVESYHVVRSELIGREGTALYPISQTAGTARLYDALRNLRQLDCRIPEGDAPIGEGERLVVTDYDPARQVFTVRRPERVFESDR
jgi:hypothetical protein